MVQDWKSPHWESRFAALFIDDGRPGAESNRPQNASYFLGQKHYA